MKPFIETFNWKAFFITLAVSIVLAALGSLVIGLSFWMLLIITICAILINGFVAEIEERRSREKSKDIE